MATIITGLIIFNIVNIPVYRYLFKAFFPTHGDFNEALNYSIRPDLFSLFKGEYLKDVGAEMKLKFFIGLCALLLFGEIALLKVGVDWFTAQ
jgi:hypothetical protein